MRIRKGQILAHAKRLVLATTGVAVLASPLPMLAQTQTPSNSALAFEVASVKPHVFARNQFAFGTASRESAIRISGNRVTLQGLFTGLMLAAYQLRSFQVTGAPEWRNDEGRNEIYDIEAKAPGDGTAVLSEVRQMRQTLLTERFQLKFHRETKEMPVFELVVGANPPKLRASAPEVASTGASRGRFRMEYTNLSMSELVLRIAPQFDRPLFDRTDLTGGYDFALEYAPVLPNTVSLSSEEAAAFAKLYPADEAPPLLIALQKQLGLRVVPAKEQVEILVIDHVERPSAN